VNVTGFLASSRRAVPPFLSPQTLRPVGLVRFSILQALAIRFRQTTHGSPTPPWVFTLTFYYQVLGFVSGARQAYRQRVHRQSRGSLVFAMFPSNLQCGPITFSVAESRSWVSPPKEQSCRSWSAFGYGLRCSRLWEFDIRLLSMPALARKRSCLSTSWTRSDSIMCYPSHVETSLGHSGDGCLMLAVPAVEALVS
jgi:hypothetical protein